MCAIQRGPPSAQGRRFASRLAAAALLALCLNGAAAAHTRSQSQSAWVIEGDRLTAHVEAEAVDVTRLYALGGEEPLQQTFAAEVGTAFRVAAAGRACTETAGTLHASGAGGRVMAELGFSCPLGALARGPIVIESRLFLRVAPSHLHFLSLRDESGRKAEVILSETSPRARLSPVAAPVSESIWGALARFFPLGARHVWSGLDHIAFILALVLLVGGKLRPAALAATGFTLGHTLTLGLAATGVLRPDQQAIEALIGFTIAFVALEVGSGGRERMRAWSAPLAALLTAAGGASLARLLPLSPLVWLGLAAFVFAYPRGFPRHAAWLAGAFGLIHGCGFAGALSTLDLPRPRLLAALAGFNLGVEAAQIATIGGALLLASAAQGARPEQRLLAARLAGAALFGLGVYWWASRLAA